MNKLIKTLNKYNGNICFVGDIVSDEHDYIFECSRDQKTVIYTKSNCQYCIMAKALFKQQQIAYDEKVIGENATVEDLLARVPNAKTVPQIWLNENYIGGYRELSAFFESK